MFLKPTKTNLIGTGLLLIANFIGGLVSRFGVGLMMAGNGGTGSPGSGYAANGGFTGTGMRMAGFGLTGSIVNYVILAILFYVIISFVVETFAKAQTTDNKQSSETSKK